MKVRRFAADDLAPIARLNDRLRAGGASDVVYPEGAEQHRGGGVRERMFVADDGGEIRGAVWLREQTFRAAGEDVTCGWLKYPVAESLVDPRFNGVPASLIVHCLREQPRLFALGLGGHETPLARMLTALRWTGRTVPMLTRVVRPGHVLRKAPALRRTWWRRLGADLAAWTGAAASGGFVLDVPSRLRRRHARAPYDAQSCERLGPWADALWEATRDEYGFLAGRDAATVAALMPRTPDISWLRVRRSGADVGWACLLYHDFSIGAADRNFGTLKVGMLADGLAAPEHAAGVVASAVAELERRGADLIVSNQFHPAWIAPLRANGFRDTSSNFAFYASPQASKLLDDWNDVHVNRGDCDGPLWYRGAS